MRERLVISASRRTDLVGCYPQTLAERLQEYPPETVHSIVIWTKNPQNMIAEGPLRRELKKYQQIFVHLTITGMGHGEFEPRILPWKETVRMMGPLVDLIGHPKRISWRFDPILEVEGHGKRCSNFELFPHLASAIAPWGIETCRVSWVSAYKKVLSRLARTGWRLIPGDGEVRKDQSNQLREIARSHGMNLYFCSMEGFQVSRCIDGAHLAQLHPEGLPCSEKRAKGQRQLCGCTESLDIGWYSLCCKHGCLYCYATP